MLFEIGMPLFIKTPKFLENLPSCTLEIKSPKRGSFNKKLCQAGFIKDRLTKPLRVINEINNPAPILSPCSLNKVEKNRSIFVAIGSSISNELKKSASCGGKKKKKKKTKKKNEKKK